MNDFTKKELEFLKSSIREHYKTNKPLKGSTYINVWANMINKIQSMIENYDKPKECEHLNIVKGAYPRSNPPKQCPDCGVLYYE